MYGVNDQLHAHAALLYGKNPSARWIGGWTEPRACLHTVENKKISPPSETEHFFGCAAHGLVTKPASLFIIYFNILGFLYMGACVKNTAEL
jgi:hypothetical protein